MARILVVDDDPDLRHFLSVVLRRSGYAVEEAADGTEALRKAIRIHFDAAVVDYQMPPPDGLELLSQLRDLQPRCVRLLMSGALDLPTIMNAVNRGEVSRVVEKPFTRPIIVGALEEALTARNRFEALCAGVLGESFDAQRRQLEECLSGGALRLALQPIVSAADGTVRAYEALLRSDHPELDTALLVIAAAERHEAVGRLADCIASCARVRLESLPADVILFLNVHPVELSDFDCVRRRFGALAPWAHRVVLEITERSHVMQMIGWRGVLDFLADAGFRIAVDDLGAGYNSLSVLAELRPEFMKVDMSIVRNIDRDDRKQRLVELLSRFARATGTQLIVEGIETAEEAATVRQIGTDLLQGYFYGRPFVGEPCASR